MSTLWHHRIRNAFLNNSENSEKVRVSALQLFHLDSSHVYTIGEAERLTLMTRRTILACCSKGLVSPVARSERGDVNFDGEAIRELSRIEHLRATCGINLDEIKRVRRTYDVERHSPVGQPRRTLTPVNPIEFSSR